MTREHKDTQRGLRKDSDERARRFRDAALPCLDDLHTLARFLMRDRADADDAVQGTGGFVAVARAELADARAGNEEGDGPGGSGR